MNGKHRWCLAGLALSCLLVACSSESKHLTLAFSSEEPAPSISEVVQSTLNERGFEIRLTAETNASDVLDAILARKLDLAIIEEPDTALPGLMTLAPLYPSVLHVLHRKTSVPADFSQLLRGASVYAGPPGGSGYRLLMQLAEDFGLTPDDFRLLDNPWTDVPDIYFILGGLLPPESVQQLKGYRLFSFAMADDPDGGSVADGIALRHHHVRPFLLPKGVYSGLGSDAVLTLSIRSLLVAHEDFKREFAYDISAAMFSGAQEISLSYPLVTRELNENLKASELMLPLHDGARRFLDRDGPGFIERNVDLIALYFTLFLAMGSGVIALLRHRQQVRKDRVDVYFRRLLDIRARIEEGSHDPIECRADVLAVQAEVMNLLIDERISADASLIAFLFQSNQLVSELSALADT